MQVGDMLEQIWKLLGEPTDLNPDSSSGRTLLLKGLNLAIKQVAAWKDPVRGWFFNYNKFRKEVFKHYSPLTNTAGSGSDDTDVEISSLPTGETDIAGAILSIDGEDRIIISNNGTTCTVGNAFSNSVGGKEYTLYPRWLNLGSYRFIEVLKVEDYDNKLQLSNASLTEDYLQDLGTIRDPQNFYRIGDRVYFDTAPEEERLYRLWLFRLPKEVTSDVEEPELPEQVHFGIILWAVYWGYQWKQEPRDAYAAQERFKDFMRSLKTEYDVKDEMRNSFNLSIRTQ